MKTLLIQLEPHDDLISIRDRMDWAKTPRILLVWPRKGRVGVRPLDLALLRRHAATLGAELGLVTRAGEIRAAARELGIPFFRSTADAQKKAWAESGPHGPVRRFPRVDLRAVRERLHLPDPFDVQDDPLSRVGIFALGVLALLAVLLVFVPSAEVRVTSPEQPQSLLISVSAAPDAQAVQLSGAIPMHSLSLILDGADNALATGQVILPDKKAEGVGFFINLTRKPIIIPAETVIRTESDPPVAFVTVTEAEVPAGKNKGIEIPIRAVEPGSGGNISPNLITAFEGPLGEVVEVTNPLATSGGTDKPAAAATNQDWEYLRSRLLADMERQARSQFASQVADGDVLLPSTFKQVQVFDEVMTPTPGQVGEKLKLTLTAEYSISYASAADLQKLAVLVMDASLPAGAVPSARGLSYNMASQPVDFQGIVRWQVRADRLIRTKIDAGQVVSLVAGKTARRAGSLLTETFKLSENPQITIRPVWWPWLPFLPIRITVES